MKILSGIFITLYILINTFIIHTQNYLFNDSDHA